MTKVALRRVFRIVNGGTPTSDESNWGGDVQWATPIDLARHNGGRIERTERTLTAEGLSSGSRAVDEGGLIVSTRAPVGYIAETAARMAFNQGCRGLEPRSAVDIRYFRYQLGSMSEQLQSRGQGSTFVELSSDALAESRVTLPPLAEQRAIADYLDAEIARIDALIAKKQQLIHLLGERFDAAREQLLTRPQGHSLVPSRTGFFDEVPERWQETTLRHLGVEVQTGPFGSQLHAEEYVEGGWPVVNPANIRDGRIRRIDNMTISDAKRDELSRHILRPGDIVFGRRGEMGRAGLIGESEAGWLCGTGSLRLRIESQRLAPAYLAELLRTDALRNYFTLMSVGSTMDNLNSEIVLSMPCLVPDLAQQRALVDELVRTRVHFERLVDHLTRQNDLVIEHRQALITAAVTGEFAVPGAA